MTPSKVLCLSMCFLLAGCNVVAFPVMIFMPDKTIDAEFELDKDARVLIMADAMAINLSQPQFKQRLCNEIAAELTGYELVKSVVPARVAMAKAAQLDRQYSASKGSAAPLSELMAATDADVAIYMELRSFSLLEHSDSPLWSPKVSMYLRVVDSQGKQLWPTGFTRGKGITVTLDSKTSDRASMATELSEKLAAEAAEMIVKKFRSYKQPRQ